MAAQPIKILGKHKQSFDLIRSLAITCHALDLSAEKLFVFGTFENATMATKDAFDTLLSANLLHLAVAIRTNIYQRSLNDQREIGHCGFLDVNTKNGTETRTFSIKDVCDKIIHAYEIHRELQESVEHSRTVTIVRGEQGGHNWELSFSIELFCEELLNWLDDLATRKIGEQ